MMPGDVLNPLKVGQGARHLEQTVGRAQGQGQPFAGTFQPAFIGFCQLAVLAQPWQVEEGIGTALAFLLAFTGLGDLRRGCCGVVAILLERVQCGGFPGNSEVQVDPIQQRPESLLR